MNTKDSKKTSFKEIVETLEREKRIDNSQKLTAKILNFQIKKQTT